MGILDWFKAEKVERKAMTLDQLIARYNSQADSVSGVVVNEMTALRVATVMACVMRVSSDLATMPLEVRRRNPDGTSAVAVRSPEYKMLMSRPNHWQTSFEFRQMMTAQAMMRGNGYAKIERDGAGKIRALYPLLSDEVSVNWVGMEPVYTVSAYDGVVFGDFGRSDIFHLRRISWDGKTGLDGLQTGRDAIGLAISAESTQAKSFKNGSRMPGYWRTEKDLTEEQVDRLASQLVAATSGKNAYRSPLLDSGLEYKATGQSFEESQLLETRKHQMIEVCAALGVLPAVLGIDDKTQAFASVDAMFRAHLVHTLRPWLVAWEQALDRDILDDKGPLYAHFDTSEMEKASTKERAESYRTLVELGILTRNEARQIEGFDRLEGLDEPLTPMNMNGAQDAGTDTGSAGDQGGV